MTDENQAAPASSVASGNPASRKLSDAIERAIDELIDAASGATTIDPTCETGVCNALEVLRGAIRKEVLPAVMTPEIAEVLGLPNFRTGPIAHVYRAAGHEIRPKMEDEQAFVLFRFLHLALQHGTGWFAESCIDLSAAHEVAKAKLDAKRQQTGDAS